MKKIFVVAPHPTQYHAGIYKELMRSKKFNFEILFLDDFSISEFYEEEFKVNIKWDIDLTKGYKYKFIKNFIFRSNYGFFSRINFHLISLLIKDRPFAIVVHGYSTFSDILVIIFAKLFRINLILKGEATLTKEISIAKLFLKKIILGVVVHLADAVLYSCSGNKKYWEYFGANPSKIFSFPCSVDNVFFNSAIPKARKNIFSLKKKLGIRSRDFVIIFCGRLTDRKRPMDLLKAVSNIANNNIKILFIGNGLLIDQLSDFSKKNNIQSIFLGFKNQTELAEYYILGNLGVVCSSYDPSPKVLNELMNFSMPIIVSEEVGTSSDLVNQGINGFVIKAGNYVELGEKINFLNKNRIAATKMGSASKKIVASFNYKSCRIGLERALDNLIYDF